MSASVQHPERLPWFAAGTLEPADAASIEGHLETCAECRAEVEALRSMARTLRAFAPTGHLTPEILVAYHGDPGALSPEERSRVEDHLRSCLPCRADLRALLRADASRRTFGRRQVLGAAASVLVVVLAGWQIATWRAPAPSPQGLAHVVLMPPQRGAVPRIPAGPCVLDLVLPLAAPDGVYVARIQPSDGHAIWLGKSASKEQRLSLPVRDGLAPGRYVLFLSPQGGDALLSRSAVTLGTKTTEEYAYGLDVEASP